MLSIQKSSDASPDTLKSIDKPVSSFLVELDKLRPSADIFFDRWRRDEDGWRKLPPRAWPTVQPDTEEIPKLTKNIKKLNCPEEPSTSMSEKCFSTIFDLATALVFNNVDNEGGMKRYRELAKCGNLDAVVAVGVCLIEIDLDEKSGVKWLRQAADAGSPQGQYELGCCLYRGIPGVLEEDENAAFELFSAAAETNHTGALYMTGDCLLEGIGCEKDGGRAVPMLYTAAENGHRFARQRIRELLRDN
eukprot:GSMAST32.ASY1.ANO1.307.1 assembled CDS